MIRTIPLTNDVRLTEGLKRLKMRHTRELLDSIIEIAVTEEPSYIDFLSYIVDLEVRNRDQTQKQQRLKAAGFPTIKTFDTFDFEKQNTLNQQAIMDLAKMGFIESKENLIFLGPAGVGKTHLAIAFGHGAVMAGHRVKFFSLSDLVDQLYAGLGDGSLSQKIRLWLRNDLIIIDEVGYTAVTEHVSDAIFQFMAKAYEHRSLIITSNLPFNEWGQLFSSPSTASAVLDRLLHHAHVFSLKGSSYRIHSRITSAIPE